MKSQRGRSAALGCCIEPDLTCVDPDRGGGRCGTVARRGVALECLDDYHATAAARTRVRLGFGGLGAGIAGLGLCRRHVEQAARPGVGKLPALAFLAAPCFPVGVFDSG